MPIENTKTLENRKMALRIILAILRKRDPQNLSKITKMF